ncbi:MAG: phage tail tape measure C-terminal domain-containing protein [Roseinatronobacter sp.]
MSTKQVSVRLSATGGRQVRAELEGVGAAGARGFGRLTREMEAANRRMEAFWRRAGVAAAAATAALAAAAGAMIRSGLQVVDAQAKLAASLDTTVASIQVLERAGDLAGVSMGQIEQATLQLTRRLSQAASGTGPAVSALNRLRLSASELQRLPLDQRIALIQDRLAELVPEAERAAVASQLFGDRAALVFGRIDSSTLARANQDLIDFGVIVSDQDAAQIERTNDAISRLGLLWRGVSNQLTVAVAPALEAVVNALAAFASVTGPLGRAIQLIFDNLGRLASIALAFAGFMAGRFVAGMVAAALSVRGLATALVFLRGAIIRTGIGALIVGAGELIYWFGQLVQSTGGFSEALTMLADVAREVWSRMGLGLQGLNLVAQASWLRFKALAAEALDATLQTVVAFANSVINTFRGALNAIIALWGALPPAIGDLAIQAANTVIGAVESMLNGVASRINGFIGSINAALARLPDWASDRLQIGSIGSLEIGRLDNPFAGAAAAAGTAAREAFAAAFNAEPLAAPDIGLRAYAEGARAAADEVSSISRALRDLAGAPMQSVAALREAMASAGDGIGDAALSTERLHAAFEEIAGGDTGASGGGARGGSGGSAARASAAGVEAGAAVSAAAQEAARGWEAVTEALRRYADEAQNTGKQIGEALTSAFRGVEDAFVSFVTKGKVDFQALADSILADITRIALRSAILGPLASALGGAFGGTMGGGLLAGIFHDGGVVGGPSQMRAVPAMAFAGAPRLHSGGWAGLRPDEVPAILQRGELVLSRAQLRAMSAAQGAGGTGASERPVQVVMRITTPDANSFRLSQGQILADMRRGIGRATRNT